MRSVTASSWRRALLVLVLGVIIWLPRGFELDRFITTDEVIWLWRSANYYYALGQRDFGATYLNASPGVVTMWVETAAFLLEFPEYRGFGQGMLDKYALFEKFLAAKGIDPHEILVTSRIIMVILNTLALTAAFILAWRLFGMLPALIGFLLLAFDPFHLAITRLAHLDGPMGSFLFLSLIAFLAYLHDGQRIGYLLVSAAAGGAAILAKAPGLIIIPAIGLIALENQLFNWKERKRAQSHPSGNFASLFIKPLILWGIASLVTILLFFPAMWVKPIANLSRLVFSPVEVSRLITEVETPASDTGEEEPETSLLQADWNGLSRDGLRYLRQYLWKTTPVILFGLLAALVFYFSADGIFSEQKIRRGAVGLVIFAVIYTILLTIPPKTSGKYYIPVYPVFDLLAGMGWVAFVGWINKNRFLAQLKHLPILILAAVILFQLISALQTFPYYSSYYNPLLGGGRKASETRMIGSGEGLDLAAEYLNAKPNARDLKAMSWYGIGPFSYYFVGETIPFRHGAYVWNQEEASRLKQADYLVVYANQWYRQYPTGLFPRLAKAIAEHTIWIDGIEYARIYDVRALPPEVFMFPE